jgi:hypothetical protein
MKIQAKDCTRRHLPNGTRPRRGTRTRIVHTLGEAFDFDNANFRGQLGRFLGSECHNARTGPPSRFCVQKTPRVNIANNTSAGFVLRDSP